MKIQGQTKQARNAIEAGETIAVIGMACRFPQAADLESFWSLQREGAEAISVVARDRWNANSCFQPGSAASGKMSSPRGGFLSNIGDFDASFFGIHGNEACAMDPQHRLLLEVTWEALENASLPPSTLQVRNAGVYVGISGSDYARACLNNLSEINAYSATGNAPSLAVGRVSSFFGFAGPCVGLDTGCSSSLVAVHLACQSLKAGESSVALAGGVNVILTPETTIALSQAWMLSDDGHCRSFDETADGYVRSEGCGIVVLKRLADALADGDHIRALILGSAVNHTGQAAGGITAGSAEAQQAVMQQAILSGGVTAEEIGFVEAHGVGTATADRVELKALQAVLGNGAERDAKCVIGSVKTNLGHLEAAAGIASLIRAIQILEHEEIPPHLHLQKLNSAIDWESSALEITREIRRWPRGPRPRIAGVNSFGLGGTNSHVILKEAPPRADPETATERIRCLLPLSAKTEAALRELAGRYARYLTRYADVSPTAVCRTAAVGRTHFSERLAVVGSSTRSLARSLARFSRGAQPRTIISGRREERHARSIQSRGMDQELISLGRLYVQGANIEWDKLTMACAPRISVPTYPFQRRRYWAAANVQPGGEVTTELPVTTRQPLLKELHSPAIRGRVFETEINSTRRTLDGHRLNGRAIAHGPFLCSLMVAAVLQDSQFREIEIADVNFANPLLLNDGELRTLQVTLDQATNGEASSAVTTRVFSRSFDNSSGWTLHATSRIAKFSAASHPAFEASESRWADAREYSTNPIHIDEFYESCRRSGIELAEEAQGISELWRGEGVSFGRLRNFETDANADDLPRTARVLQSGVEFVAAAALSDQITPYLPVAVDRLRISSEASTAVWGTARVRAAVAGPSVQGDAWFFSETGKVVAEIRGLQLTSAARIAGLETSVVRPEPALTAGADVTAFLHKLNTAEPNRRYFLLLDFLREQIAKLLDLESGRQVAVDKGFFDLGLDSLAVIELKNRIHQAAGHAHDFPAALLFEHSTPESLAKYLASNVFHFDFEADDESISCSAADPIVDEVKLLPEQRLDELLNEFDEWSTTGAPN